MDTEIWQYCAAALEEDGLARNRSFKKEERIRIGISQTISKKKLRVYQNPQFPIKIKVTPA